MITIFHLLDSEKLNDYELNILNRYFDAYINDNPNETWLKNINLNQITFKWCKNLTQENNVLGAWDPFNYNSVFIRWFDRTTLTRNKYQDQLKYENHFLLTFPTIIHELYHRHQCKTFTYPIYLLLAIPIWRNYTIQKPAYELEDKVAIWTHQYDNKLFKQRFNKLHIDFYRK